MIRLRDLVLGDLVYVVDPPLVRKIFQGEPQQLRAGEVNSLMEPVAGPRPILLLDEPDHMRVRSVGSKPGLRRSTKPGHLSALIHQSLCCIARVATAARA